MSSARIQEMIHKLEMGGGSRYIWTLALMAALTVVGVLYDLRAYRGFSSPDAMDTAQVARNLSEGRGYTTQYIRPFSIYRVQKHSQVANPSGTNDVARLNGFHPDLANAPLYPAVLAGMMKTWKPSWQVETNRPFWSEGGLYMRYKPEFRIAIFNQVLLCVVTLMVFFIARKLFDSQAAWLSASLTFGSALLWRFSVSGLSTMLLLVIFLGLIWCLIKTEEAARAETPVVNPTDAPPGGRMFALAAILGVLTAAGLLTRYSFGWMILPVVGFLLWYGGFHRRGMAVVAILAFMAVISPWLGRNYLVSGKLFGTASYAVLANVEQFPGDQLMQSMSPDFTGVRWTVPLFHKLLDNLGNLLTGDILTTGGWAGVLFFAGLLLGWRSLAATRLRYFILASLGVLLVAQALGRTALSDASPEFNSENLLVLLLPLINIFAVAFLLTLVEQMKPNLAAGYVAITAVVILTCGALPWTIFSKAPTLDYPPYYPPEIQKVAGWMQPGELMMSDVPWAVAWYGDRQCVDLTKNCNTDFYALNDYIKSVQGLYLTTRTLDSKLMSEAARGNAGTWDNFAYKLLSPGLTLDEHFPPAFPLKEISPSGLGYGAGIFLTDRSRWLVH